MPVPCGSPSSLLFTRLGQRRVATMSFESVVPPGELDLVLLPRGRRVHVRDCLGLNSSMYYVCIPGLAVRMQTKLHGDQQFVPCSSCGHLIHTAQCQPQLSLPGCSPVTTQESVGSPPTWSVQHRPDLGPSPQGGQGFTDGRQLDTASRLRQSPSHHQHPFWRRSLRRRPPEACG